MGTMRKSGWVGAVTALMLMSCVDDEVSSPVHLRVLAVAIAPDSGMIDAIAGRVKLTVQVDAAEDASGDFPIEWASLDSSVAMVNEAGEVTAMAVGRTRIAARVLERADTAAVVVDQAAASVEIGLASTGTKGRASSTASSKVVLDRLTLTLPDDTVRLVATARDRNGYEIMTARPQWASLDTTVAAVDDEGLVTVVGDGETGIVATVEERADTVSVEAESGDGAVTVSLESATFHALGQTIKLTATVQAADGSEVPGAEVSWTSLEPEIAEVNTMGLVTAKLPGVALIVAAAAVGRPDTVTITVAPPVAAVRVLPAAAEIEVGDTLRLTATALDASGNPIPGMPCAWISSDPAVATVDTSGLVTGVAEGQARIIASIDDAQGSANITVSETSSGTPPAPGDGLLFTDDFESYPAEVAADRSEDIQGEGANGFRWGSGGQNTYVSDAEAFSGTQSLAFLYRGDPGDPAGDASSQRRFVITPDAESAPREIWIEYMLRVPDNWKHRDGTGPDNNKLFAIWAEEYSAPDGTQVIIAWDRVSDAQSSASLLAIADDGATRETAGTIFDASMRGSWIRLRIHIATSSTPGAGDGVMEVWRDDSLILSLYNYDLAIADGLTYFRNGYLMGWSNSGFDEDTYFYMDDVRIYTSDPKW